jgi:hypothetical protein
MRSPNLPLSRLSLSIDSNLKETVRMIALANNESVSTIVDSAVRAYLLANRSNGPEAATPLPQEPAAGGGEQKIKS